MLSLMERAVRLNPVARIVGGVDSLTKNDIYAKFSTPVEVDRKDYCLSWMER